MIINSGQKDKKEAKFLRLIPHWLVIVLLWLLGGISDRLWYSLDSSVPAWDQADYLNGALNYWNALQNPQWFDSQWWRSFWLLSNKIPPLHYILTTPFLSIFGLSEDAASGVMLLYSGMLLLAVYGLGVILFNKKIGIYAAALSLLLPGLYYYRLEFLLDYPLTAITIFSFWLLTLWKVKQPSWLLTVAFGFSLGCAVLLKQTALFFLFIPLLWLFVGYCKNLQWLRIIQLISSILIGIAICYPWYRTNWLLILTSGKRATIDSAIIEGDPALNTLDAWLYYFKTLPYLLSWHLLLIPLVGVLLYLVAKVFKLNTASPRELFKHNYSIRWLTVYFIGGYLLSSLNINKDARYILPLLPILTLFIAVGMQFYKRKWRNYIQSFTFILAVALMLLNIFPLPGIAIAKILSPKVQHQPYTKQPLPHQEVIEEIITTEPYLRTTLGVLPSTPAINQHNFSFYGGLEKFQVVGRQVGIRENEVVQDMRSLFWFITKTGDQGSIPEAQKIINQEVTTSPNFKLHKSWQLPDNSSLNLYRKTQPTVEVTVANQEINSNRIKISQIILPKIATVNQTVPITYQWLGSGKQLKSGIVLLTWQLINSQTDNITPNYKTYWISDRSIAMGMLSDNLTERKNSNQIFQVIENTAMLVPENITPGQYKLKATYLNRQTKESYELKITDTTITIEANANIPPSDRELDLVTQLRTIAPTMASGITALEPIFAQTARINQYDGQQDYLKQTEIALSYRLQNNPVIKKPTVKQKLDWYYAIALSQVLQQDVKGAISSWQNITNLAPNNPYNYAYLAFVYLYDWQAKPATIALNKAEAIDPNIPEVKTLQGVAALMQGKLIKAWNLLVVSG